MECTIAIKYKECSINVAKTKFCKSYETFYAFLSIEKISTCTKKLFYKLNNRNYRYFVMLKRTHV